MSETPEPTPEPSTKTKKPSRLEHPLAGKILAGLLVLSLTLLFTQWKADWFSEVVSETGGKPRWTYLVPLSQAAVTALAGVVAAYLALWQFNRTHKQREDQYREQQDTIRIQFDRKHLEEQFNDIQNRLSSENPSMRANAALRLAQLAETLRPGSETTDYTLQNNPFFARAVSQLSIALNMEKDLGVRAAIVDAIKNLTLFAADKPNEYLLSFLINTLADANRTAYRNFIKVLAAFWVARTNDEKTWEQLSVVASFCEDTDLNKAVLIGQIVTPDFQNDAHVLKELWEATNDCVERRRAEANQLVQVQESVHCLKQTQRTLTLCLKRRDETHGVILLRDTFLVGADLKFVQLQRANLYCAQVQGADLSFAHIQGAHMTLARLQGADLNGAQLQGADLTDSQLTGAKFRGTRLQNTVVYASDLDQAVDVDEGWREAIFEDWLGEEDTELYQRMEARFGKKEKGKQTENINTPQSVVSPIAATLGTTPLTEENTVIVRGNTQYDD